MLLSPQRVDGPLVSDRLGGGPKYSNLNSGEDEGGAIVRTLLRLLDEPRLDRRALLGRASVTSPAAPIWATRRQDVFGVEPTGEDTFSAVVRDRHVGRPFGGHHLMGLASRAASATVEAPVAAVPHAVRARFLRAGKTGESSQIVGGPGARGRTIAVRRLTDVQAPRVLLAVEPSFHAGYKGASGRRSVPRCGLRSAPCSHR
jgi:hypothetical protein